MRPSIEARRRPPRPPRRRGEALFRHWLPLWLELGFDPYGRRDAVWHAYAAAVREQCYAAAVREQGVPGGH